MFRSTEELREALEEGREFRMRGGGRLKYNSSMVYPYRYITRGGESQRMDGAWGHYAHLTETTTPPLEDQEVI